MTNSSAVSQQDLRWMSRAIQLAAKGKFTTSPNPNVGCVIVKDGEIVGEGFHQRAGEAHAEVNALAQAKDNARGACCYVSLEPCSHQGKTGPCADALIAAGVRRVVCAMQDPNPLVAGRGLEKLRDAGIDVECGVLQSDAEQLNPGFIQMMKTGKPYIQLKMAQSLDGRTAMANGESKWITSGQAREDVQQFRAQASAIVCTSKTVLADDASMNVRAEQWQHAQYSCKPVRQPLRVVCDRKGLLVDLVDAQSGFFSYGPVLWVVGEKVSVSADALPEHVELVTLAENADKSGFDLSALVGLLAQRGLHSIWVESGAQFAGAWISESLVDDIVLYAAPKFMGSSARPLLDLPLESMKQAVELDIVDVRHIGNDIRIRATLRK